MGERLRVFVSSRMRELAGERVAVEQALEAMGADAFVFEGDAGARPGPVVATYRDELAASDVYLGIFWLGYGDYTRDEYDSAVRLDLPCLIYEKPPGPGEQRDPELQRFLDEVADVDTGHVTTAWFQSAEQLAGWVRRDVDRLRDEALRSQIRAGAYRYRHGRLGGRLDREQPPVVKLRRPPRAACPAPPDPFIDRERPLARIAAAIDGGARLVGFRGEPGMGKSALLARLAQQRAGGHPDGAICVAGADHAARRDVLVDVWSRFHETAVAYVPDDARLDGDLAGRQALVTVDDVRLSAGEVERLAAALPQSVVALTAAPAAGLDPLSYAKAMEIGPLTEPADVVAMFEAGYGEAVPPDLRDALVSLCRTAGGGPGHVKHLAGRAWASDASLADWLRAAEAAIAPDRAAALRPLAAAGPGVPVPAGVAVQMGVAPATLASLEADALIRAASPRYVLEGPGWAAVEGAEPLLPDLFGATVAWAAAAPAEEIAGGRAFLAEMLRWGAAHGRRAAVFQLARRVEGALAAAGWWGAWELALDAAGQAAGDDPAAAAWVDHQRGTRLGALGATGEAEVLLGRAVATRLELGDLDGAALSRHNLAQLAPPPPPLPDRPPDPPPPPPPPEPPPPPRPWWRNPWLAVAGAGVAVVATLAVLAVLLLPAGSGALAATPDPLSLSSPLGEPTTAAVTLTNQGDAALEITGAELVGDAGQFRLDDPAACNGRLATREACRLAVTFLPSGPGEQRAELRVATSEAPLTVAVTGLGTAAELEVQPAAVDFDPVPVGRSSEPREVTVANRGNLAARLDRLAIDGPAGVFDLDATACGPELAGGAECTVRVTFTPPAGGGHAATLVVEGGGLAATADLRGAGQAGQLAADPAVADFEGVAVGGTGELRVRITNEGPGDVTVASVALVGDGPFSLREDGCAGATLADGGECGLLVEFRPTTRGPALGGVVLVADGEESRVALTGNGLQGDLTLSPPDVDYGEVEVGGDRTATVTIGNEGNGDVVVTGLDVAPDEFAIADQACLEAVIAPQGRCDVEVVFEPGTAGAVAGSLEVAARIDATEGPDVEVTALRGAGTQPEPGQAFFSEPPVADFQGTPTISWLRVRDTETRDVVITNVGGAPLLMQFRVSGLDDPPFEPVPPRLTVTTFVLRPVVPILPPITLPDDPIVRSGQAMSFAIVGDTCGEPLGPGERCRLTLSFTPQNLGSAGLTLFARLDVAYLQGGGPDPPCCLLVGSSAPVN